MGMACSVSGTGEPIIRANFARKLSEALNQYPNGSDYEPHSDPHEILNQTLVGYWESCQLWRGAEVPSVGVILLTVDNSEVRLWCAFTTASMAIAYASSENPKPKAVILRHPHPHTQGTDGKAQIYITSLSI